MLTHWCKILIIAGLALGVLCGCGGSENQDGGTELAALPTRTAAPQGSATPDSVPPSYTVYSLRAAVQAFLSAAPDRPLIEQSSAFVEIMNQSGVPCLEALGRLPGGYELLFKTTWLQLPMFDFAAWQTAVNTFPDEAMLPLVQETLATAWAAYPLDQPLHVCLMPVPVVDPPLEETRSIWNQPHELALSGLGVLVPDANTLFVLCARGEGCLDDLAPEVLRGYGLVYRRAATGIRLDRVEVDGRAIDEGIAVALVRELAPEAALRGAEALDSAQMAVMLKEIDLRTNVDFYPWDAADILYGHRGSERFPPWGGVAAGYGLVQAYQAAHPGVLLAELAALEPGLIRAAYQPD